MNEQKNPVPLQKAREEQPVLEKQIASVCLGVAAIVLLSVLFQVLAVALIGSVAPDAVRADWFSVAVSSVPMYCFAMPISFFVFRFGKAYAPSRGKALGFGMLAGLVAVSFGVAMIGSRLGSAVQEALSSLTGAPVVNPVEEMTFSTPFWANLLFCGIFAPVAEEIVYRKLVIDRLRPLGDLSAVMISGLLFGLIHGNLSQFFYAALFGIVAGFVYVRTGKLRYTVILHLAVNLVGGVFSTEIIRALGGTQAAGDLTARFSDRPVAAALYLGYVLLMLLCVVLTPIVLFLLRKHARLPKTPHAPSAARVVAILARNPAVWLLAVIVVLMFVL